MNDFMERYSIVLDELIERTEKMVQKDLAGDGRLRTARRVGAMEALRACAEQGPEKLASILNEEPPEVLKQFVVNYSTFGIAEYDRTINWVAHCISAFLIINGQTGIVEDVNEHAVMEMLDICKKL